MEWCTVSTAVTCCVPRVDSLGCIKHPGKLYLLKGALWTGGPSGKWVQGCGQTLSSQITVGSLSSSSEVVLSRE
jgi:hypothetical protein